MQALSHAREVVVTGMGAVTPAGCELAALGPERLLDSAEGVARCASFDPSEWLSVKQRRRADRFVQMALCAAREALAHAGWEGQLPYDPTRIGVIVGSCFGGSETTVRELDAIGDKTRLISPLALPTMLPSSAAAALSIEYGLEGECVAPSAACASGAQAIAVAARLIRSGELDAVLAGGAEAPITRYGLAAFQLIGAMSPSGTARPFDRDRDGFVMGEGAGVLVLEDGERARARSAALRGRIAGFACTGDAFHITAPHPRGVGATRAMTLAIEDAAISASEIVYVNAHGTGTEANDRVEAAAIGAVFGAAPTVPVSSIKSATGHSMGAAGAIEAIATLLALERRLAPPTAGLRNADPQCELHVADVAVPLASGRAIGLSNSFGFGGHNVVLALEATGDQPA